MTTKVTPPTNAKKFTPNTQLNKGDIILAPGDLSGGWWVVLNIHISANGNSPDGLKPGQSNDNYHWSVGPS